MTWNKDAEQGFESRKVLWELVPYMRGRCLDLGCGPYKTFPHFIGVDSCKDTELFGIPINPDIKADVTDLGLFGSGSVDMVFSSHVLEHIPYENVGSVLKEWMRVLKVGGHLCLYLPDADEYPKCGAEFANPDHKWDVTYEKMIAALGDVPYSWDMIDFQKRNQGREYSLFFVVKKLGHELVS